jgi:FtsH-binding integral membrane protein
VTGSWDRYFAAGFFGIILVCVVQFFVGNSGWWYRVAGWVTA